jgi:hypothetical protein
MYITLNIARFRHSNLFLDEKLQTPYCSIAIIQDRKFY